MIINELKNRLTSENDMENTEITMLIATLTIWHLLSLAWFLDLWELGTGAYKMTGIIEMRDIASSIFNEMFTYASILATQ